MPLTVSSQLSYFKQKLEYNLEQVATAFKYARYFNPLCPSSVDANHLKSLYFLNDQLEDTRASLIPRKSGVGYLKQIVWWRKYTNELPHWSTACKLALLWCCHPLQQWSIFFTPPHSYNHWKKLKHPLCYNIITGSDADCELILIFVQHCVFF